MVPSWLFFRFMPNHAVRAFVFSIACLGFAAGPTSQTGTPAHKPAVLDPAKAEALSAAVRKGDLAVVKQLLDAGDPRFPPSLAT